MTVSVVFTKNSEIGMGNDEIKKPGSEGLALFYIPQPQDGLRGFSSVGLAFLTSCELVFQPSKTFYQSETHLF